jgi:GTP cyclohydrolase I
MEHLSLFDAAKSTVSRLNASPQENAAREQRMASAVRTILECIGEDPDREGLKRTPERYAQAIMWMTRGYEERLAGQYTFLFLKFFVSLKRRSFSHRRNQRCYFCGRP